MNCNSLDQEAAEGLQSMGTFALGSEGSPVINQQTKDKAPWMIGLREGVIDFGNAFDVYINRMNTEDRLSRTIFAISLTSQVVGINLSVDTYLDALDKGECVSVLDNFFWEKVKNFPQLEGSRVEQSLLCEIIPLKVFNLEIALGGRKLIDTSDIYLLLKESMADVKRKLKKALKKLSEVKSEFYEDLYEKEKARFDFDHVECEFYDLGLKKASISYDDLDVFRTKEVLHYLLGGGLSHNEDPLAQDLALVQEEEVKKRMPHNFKYPDDFRDLCARIIPYRYWKGNEFHLKKAELGCYLHNYYYDMTLEERRAIFDLEVMMELVNDKIRNDFPEKAEESESEETEDCGDIVNDVVGGCFRNVSEFVHDMALKIVNKYYLGSAVNLTLIEITFYDHNLLKKRNAHKALIKALMVWGIIPVLDEKEIAKITNGMAYKMKQLPTDGYQEWNGSFFVNDKKTCSDIGKELGPTIPYHRKTEA